jgi:hypothetical protein
MRKVQVSARKQKKSKIQSDPIDQNKTIIQTRPKTAAATGPTKSRLATRDSQAGEVYMAKQIKFIARRKRTKSKETKKTNNKTRA